jgi:hypothetical protein
MDLARGQNESKSIAQCVGEGVDFGRQTTTGASYRLVHVVFFVLRRYADARANDRRVDHHIFGVAIAGQVFQKRSKPRPHTIGRSVDGYFPRAEARWQIAPRNACAVAIENGVNEQPVLLHRAAHVTLPARKKVFDPLPFVIAQSARSIGQPQKEPTAYESEICRFGNPAANCRHALVCGGE